MKTLATFTGMVCVVWTTTLLLPEVESSAFPVLNHIATVQIEPDHNDVHVTLSLAKVRSCTWLPPWRARTETGRPLQVVHEEIDMPNWEKSNRIVTKVHVLGVGHESFSLVAQHTCHPFWDTWSFLGKYKAPEDVDIAPT